MRVERLTEPVAVLREEREDLERYFAQPGARPRTTAFAMDLSGNVTNREEAIGAGPIIGVSKPAYRNILAGQDGRVWIKPFVTAEYREPKEPTRTEGGVLLQQAKWTEPPVFDVFEVDGSFLGRIKFAHGEHPMFMRGDRVWVLRLGESDEPYVVRYRIAHRRN